MKTSLNDNMHKQSHLIDSNSRFEKLEEITDIDDKTIGCVSNVI